MSAPLALLDFQQRVADGVLARLDTARDHYAALPPAASPALVEAIAKHAGAVMLCAPTGAGKTLLAADVLARFASATPIVWFWFAPFAGLVEQARGVLRAQAPALRQLDLEVDRRLDAVRGGGVFVTTWQSVASANKTDRKARVRGDAGQSLDDLIVLARAEGLRIGCVVDEAHHSFQKSNAKETRAFFIDVLRPDYTLMMSATPRDTDAQRFERDTGYRVGDTDEWITVSRVDGVEAGLLKRGVKLVRFLAPDNESAVLVDYERNALAQCTHMHRHLRQQLVAAGVALTPLMLVQVPNGGAEMKEAQRILIQELGFAESSVRIHTASEPDPDLIALAHDPGVEVLIFKMAVALGFDAPRAFTLAALRGARDKDFGVQVIGRLMRVHPLLRHRDLPPELSFGYVFLANAESQEGLLSAGDEISRLTTQVPELGAQTVVSVIGSTHTVQILRSGENASLLVDAQGVHGSPDTIPAPLQEIASGLWAEGAMQDLFAAGAESTAATKSEVIVNLLSRDAARRHHYPLRDGVPRTIVTEYLPPAEVCTEQHIADRIDFSKEKLGAMHQTLTRLRRVERDVFTNAAEDSESYVQANLDPEQVSGKVARQLGLFDVDPRVLLEALAFRLGKRLAEVGIPVPDNDEALDRALDFVLLHHPELLRNAFKAVRMSRLDIRTIELPPSQVYDDAREPSRRNAYGVVPTGFDSDDERDFAHLLDRCDDVLWWHRNPSQRPESLRLYQWDDGAAFHPDFLVAYRGRASEGHIALVEVKGPRGWRDTTDVAKANGPPHERYGRCIFVGRERGGRFQLLKPHAGELARFGDFDPAQLRWVDR